MIRSNIVTGTVLALGSALFAGFLGRTLLRGDGHAKIVTVLSTPTKPKVDYAARVREIRV